MNKNEMKDALCFGTLKRLERLWKNFETETKSREIVVTASLRYACLCFPVMTARESISPDWTLSLFDMWDG